MPTVKYLNLRFEYSRRAQHSTVHDGWRLTHILSVVVAAHGTTRFQCKPEEMQRNRRCCRRA